MKSLLTLLFTFVSTFSLVANPCYYYENALVRQMSKEFTNSLKRHAPDKPINVALAAKQHQAYSNLIAQLVKTTTELQADTDHPDCNFIEDTAIIACGKAVISRMGAKERRGEEIAVRQVLSGMESTQIHELQAPATMDGGDILNTGRHLFVGISSRTNSEAVKQLSEIFDPQLSVISIQVGDTLHLKSIISLFDADTIVVSDDPDVRAIITQIQEKTSKYNFLLFPDRVAANVLRINDTLIIQDGFPKSEAILRKKAEESKLNIVVLQMSELIKADGALTCGSLLF